MTVWICGKNVVEVKEGIVWDIVGVFATEQEAVEACTELDHFVGPMTFGHRYPDERESWPNCYYPNQCKRNYGS